MLIEVREVLDRIDKVLAKGDQSAQDLWDILTALRGPDHREDMLFNKRPTVYVRGAAFPKTAVASVQNELRALINTDPRPPIREDFFPFHYHSSARADAHYTKHLERAYVAIDRT